MAARAVGADGALSDRRGRASEALTAAKQALADEATVVELRARLASMESAPEEDTGPDKRMELETAAEAARASEVDARLAMRTVEERTAAVSERAAALEADAESERQGRRAALERRERRARDLLVAEAVVQAITTVRADRYRTIGGSGAATPR